MKKTTKKKPSMHVVYGNGEETYTYMGDGKCPMCGGSVIIEDGYVVCVAPGICTFSAEVE